MSTSSKPSPAPAGAARPAQRAAAPDISSDLQRYAALDSLPPHLNFLCVSFDAGAALAQRNLAIPVTRVRALDNMCKAAMLLPAAQRRLLLPDEKLPSRPPLSASSEVPKSSKLKDYSRVRTGPVTTETHALDKFHDVFEDMQAMSQGTHSLLFDCLHHNHRVCIVTRGPAGVRGIMTGFISAFDKHCNLVLRDTLEEWALLCPSNAANTPHAATSSVVANASAPSVVGSDSLSSQQLSLPRGAECESGLVLEACDDSRHCLPPSPLSSSSSSSSSSTTTTSSSSSTIHAPDHTAPHWGSYQSPPSPILPSQCRLLRTNLLPPLAPGRHYAFVRKSHSQLLLLGNNVVMVHRAENSTKTVRSASDVGEENIGARVASGSDQRGDFADQAKSSKRTKL